MPMPAAVSKRIRTRHPARGFTLVEILVALLIGLVATTVILQLFTDAERRNRTAVGTADAQSSGIIAFYQLQANIQKAGYGVNAVNLLNCPLQWTVANALTVAVPVLLAPVTINPLTANGANVIPPGDLGTDTLLVFIGNGNGQPEGNKINGAPTGNVYPLLSATGMAVGDRVIVSPDSTPGACSTPLTIDRITAVNTSSGNVTLAIGGTALGAAPAIYDLGPGPNGGNALPTATVPANGPSILAYAVRGQTLTVCDFTVNDCSLPANVGQPLIWQPVATNIVSMRAVYLKDTAVPMQGMPSANGRNQAQPATPCDWVRASAVNLVLVARSDEVEHNPENPAAEYVTTATNAPTWTDNATVPLVSSSNAWQTSFSESNEWRKYRYKTFETVISMRNVAWMGVPDACTNIP